jgi:hypothetical protein
MKKIHASILLFIFKGIAGGIRIFGVSLVVVN